MGTIKCPRCGANNDEESAFCAKCGYRIQAEKFVFQGQYSMGLFKKKSSKLGIVAAIFSVFGCMCYVGLILAIIDLCIRTPNKRYRWSYFAIIACIVWTIIFGALGAYGEDYVPPEKDTTQIETQLPNTEESQKEEVKKKESKSKADTKDKAKTQETEKVETEEKEETKVKEETPKKQNKFVSALVKDGLDEKVAKKAYKILKKKIGFKKLKYIDKMEGLTNYNIEADGNDIVMTASDKVYRIFIPESDYVFYEDGKVKLTAKRFDETTYTQSEASAYYIMAQQIIEEGLDDPNGVKFPSQTFSPEDIAIAKDGDLVAVKSYVDVKNYYGTKVRIDWIVQYTVTDIDSYACNPNYVKIGDDSAGKYIKMK